MHCTRSAATILSICALGAHAGNAEWTSTGPLGGRVHEIQFDPTDPSRAYATTWGGIYRSDDGGTTWVAARNGIVADGYYPLPLALDAEQPTTLFSFDSWSRIYRSNNRGASWAILPDSLPSNVHPATIADVPGVPCKVLLGTATDQASTGTMLFGSPNCGLDFAQIGAGLPGEVAVKAIAFDPADVTHNTVLVGLDSDTTSEGNAIWRSTNGGLTFAPLPTNFFPGSGYRLEVTQIAFGPAGDIWALVGGYAVYHSDNAGLTWRDTGVTGAGTVVADPQVAGRAWVGGADGAAQVQYTDPSYSITPFENGLSPNASYNDGIRPVPAGVARLAWRSGLPPRLFASTEGSGVFALGTVTPGVWSPVVAGPAGAGIRALVLHPTDPTRLWAGQSTFSLSSPALYTSNDGGNSWTPTPNGLRAADIQALAIDPTTTASVLGTTLYAGGRAAANFGNGFRNHGIYRSDNGGQTWQALEGTLPVVIGHDIGAVRALALDAHSCTTPPCLVRGAPLNRLYVVGHGRTPDGNISSDTTHRVLRSDDRGATWVTLDGNPGFPRSNQVFALTVFEVEQRVTPTVVATHPANPNEVFVGTESSFFDFDTGNAIAIDATRASGLFRSTDAGATWTRYTNLPAKLDLSDVPYPNASLDVVDFLIDPSNPSVFWIALTDPTHSNTSTVLRSSDAGASWQAADSGLNPSLALRDLAFDPQNPNSLYAAAGGDGANPGAIYRGVFDTGTQTTRWLSISVGLPAESAYAVAVDPTNPNQIYAGTDTGVHEMTRVPDQDGDGVPDSIEDQAPDVPGGIAGPGDGNGDGFMDSLQRDVGSTGVIFRRGGAGAAITSTVVSGTGPGSAPCSQAVDVSALPPDTLPVDIDPLSGQTIAHPQPARQFDITDCATAVVDITYHGIDFSAPGWRFRLFGPEDPGDLEQVGWFDPIGVQRIGTATWRLPLTAQGPGSYRPEPDAIRLVGAPACVDVRLFADSFESVAAAMPWCGD